MINEGVNGYTFDPLDENELSVKMEKSAGDFVNKEGLRENRMPWRYEDLINDLIVKLYHLSNNNFQIVAGLS